MKFGITLRRAAKRANLPRFFRRVHKSTFAAYPQHGTFGFIERAVLERLVQITEDNSVIVFHFGNLLEFERDLLKPLFPRNLCKLRVNIFRFVLFVDRRKLQILR